ncbi:PREDICTED: RNA-directed DNA polymerase from mobile element jockey-like [Cyphomyrmex costatus]|uniref:RNA-directed DNA polymerase from mobile element jockey-like n=1 Tax=Cyphomyrmex costatus TaxID=456900 RepID=UPI000852387F|nr:PREDICTED: RNA-directed DNA polymerase from mobile element jockey-like [Cyphomyrmex costatus]
MTRVWSLIRSFKRVKTNSTANHLELQKSSYEAISKLCPPSCFPNCTKSIEKMLLEDAQSPNTFSLLNEPFTLKDLDRALSSVRKKSSPGLDQIDYEIILSLSSDLLKHLLEIYNDIFTLGVLPSTWINSLVVLIPKPGVTSVRPISLIPCLAKIMERLIYYRVIWYIESRPVLPQIQSEFRPFRSCADNLASLTTKIYTGFLSRSPTVAVFIDIAGAFDNVIPHMLVNDLLDIEVPAFVRKFVENFISKRSLNFIVDGELLGPFDSFKGTLQGSTLSPLLFNIYLKDMASHVHEKVSLLQYADDAVIFTTLSNVSDAIKYIQESLNNIYAYLRNRGLDNSPSKSKWMIFSRNVNILSPPPLLINDQEIPRVNSHRFLGVILDHKLNGNLHLKYLTEKGKNIVNIITALAGVSWGSHPSILLTVYRSILGSAIEYGAQFFNWATESAAFVKLLRIQYKAVRRAMGYRISTPINTMLGEARIPPLHLRFNLSITKHIYKSMANKFSETYAALIQMELIATRKNRRIEAIRDSPLFKIYVTVRHNSITFYTDGSKEADCSVGAGVFSPELNIQIAHKLPAETSIFSAELWAIYQAVVLALDADHSRITVFSDSKSAIEAICDDKHYQRNYIIYRVKQTILRAAKVQISVTLFWVPSHKGIPGNETADSIAKNAATNGVSANFKISHEDFFSEAREVAKHRFNSYLKTRAQSKGTLHFERYPLTSKKTWFHEYSLTREKVHSSGDSFASEAPMKRISAKNEERWLRLRRSGGSSPAKLRCMKLYL